MHGLYKTLIDGLFYTATEPRLIFTNRYYIRELSIDGSEYTLLQQGFRKAVAVDFDVIQQQLYIVDYDVTTPSLLIKKHKIQCISSI